MRYLKPPPLELFDLDQEFASKECRLAQLTNKCTSKEDVLFFVETCANIFKVPAGPEATNQNEERGKRILHHMLTTIAKYRMSSNEI